ncbi:MAG: AI-2E family transporter [Bacteroidales bacterium]|nr:AI-2E family transporter [Bacteroidales bacterium]
MKYTFDRVVRIIIFITTLILLGLLTKRLSGVLLPFLIGWLLAYLIHPLVKFIQFKMRVKYKIPSIVLAFVFIIGIITGLLYLLIPMLSAEISKAYVMISEYITASQQSGDSRISKLIIKIMNRFDYEEIFKVNSIQDAFNLIIPKIASLLSSTWDVITGICVIFIILLYTIFILKDFDNISNGFVELIPRKYRELITGIIEDLEHGMNQYFRGQFLIAMIVGVLFAIGFKIIGLPMGITIGLFIGVLNIVPYLQTIGIIPVIMLAFIKSMETGQNFWLIIGLCAIVFIIVQSTQDLFLVPRIMGKAMGLNPAIILLSLSVWGSLLGITGMIIALPITTIMISYYKRFVIDKTEKLPL